MFQSRNTYIFTVNKTISEIKDSLARNTLSKKNLIRVITNKRFIGEIYDDGFKIIGSAAISVICTLNGTFQKIDDQTSAIEIETKIHKAFIILFNCFVTIIFLIAVVGYLVEHHFLFSVMALLPVIVAALMFRLMLHIMYIRARNISIKDFEKIIN